MCRVSEIRTCLCAPHTRYQKLRDTGMTSSNLELNGQRQRQRVDNEEFPSVDVFSVTNDDEKDFAR
jgi:hypothetical protein